MDEPKTEGEMPLLLFAAEDVRGAVDTGYAPNDYPSGRLVRWSGGISTSPSTSRAPSSTWPA